jgi:hypothetical protein
MEMYEAMIKSIAPFRDPRHVEAFMRSEHPTLDGLSKSQFTKAVYVASWMVADAGADMSERLAQSFGL